MSTPIKVVVFGATGCTGRQIIDGLIKSPTNFEIVAVCRPSSVDKPQNDAFRKNGVTVVGLDITGPREPLVDVIKGADTVIAALYFLAVDQQILLIDICKEVGVGRFVPDNFQPVVPPVGVMAMRETSVLQKPSEFLSSKRETLTSLTTTQKPAKEYQDTISEMEKRLAKDPTDLMALMLRTMSQYQVGMAVRGDTTPEVADYLGYLDVYKLYPDLEPARLRNYYQRVLDGKEAAGIRD
ncbi:uncharacterized protein PpBr36_10472 [Pyricularia pennisetigena]|uniref:uncharacterized protein n=1 Tax=Pyricularia pennisetigena TaxID=1578925 RepID=UPI001153B505|nr:uncharacterized protein PpBr36_10472 [Pyricularia pennisetigena]TLS21161.1 hypothetical protein PpBr36_10472 [Pyricularia pennisetigena]